MICLCFFLSLASAPKKTPTSLHHLDSMDENSLPPIFSDQEEQPVGKNLENVLASPEENIPTATQIPETALPLSSSSSTGAEVIGNRSKIAQKFDLL